MKEEQNHPCDILHPNPQPQSYHEKTLDRSNLMDIFFINFILFLFIYFF